MLKIIQLLFPFLFLYLLQFYNGQSLKTSDCYNSCDKDKKFCQNQQVLKENICDQLNQIGCQPLCIQSDSIKPCVRCQSYMDSCLALGQDKQACMIYFEICKKQICLRNLEPNCEESCTQDQEICLQDWKLGQDRCQEIVDMQCRVDCAENHRISGCQRCQKYYESCQFLEKNQSKCTNLGIMCNQRFCPSKGNCLKDCLKHKIFLNEIINNKQEIEQINDEFCQQNCLKSMSVTGCQQCQLYQQGCLKFVQNASSCLELSEKCSASLCSRNLKCFQQCKSDQEFCENEAGNPAGQCKRMILEGCEVPCQNGIKGEATQDQVKQIQHDQDLQIENMFKKQNLERENEELFKKIQREKLQSEKILKEQQTEKNQEIQKQRLIGQIQQQSIKDMQNQQKAYQLEENSEDYLLKLRQLDQQQQGLQQVQKQFLKKDQVNRNDLENYMDSQYVFQNKNGQNHLVKNENLADQLENQISRQSNLNKELKSHTNDMHQIYNYNYNKEKALQDQINNQNIQQKDQLKYQSFDQPFIQYQKNKPQQKKINIVIRIEEKQDNILNLYQKDFYEHEKCQRCRIYTNICIKASNHTAECHFFNSFCILSHCQTSSDMLTNQDHYKTQSQAICLKVCESDEAACNSFDSSGEGCKNITDLSCKSKCMKEKPVVRTNCEKCESYRRSCQKFIPNGKLCSEFYNTCLRITCKSKRECFFTCQKDREVLQYRGVLQNVAKNVTDQVCKKQCFLSMLAPSCQRCNQYYQTCGENFNQSLCEKIKETCEEALCQNKRFCLKTCQNDLSICRESLRNEEVCNSMNIMGCRKGCLQENLKNGCERCEIYSGFCLNQEIQGEDCKLFDLQCRQSLCSQKYPKNQQRDTSKAQPILQQQKDPLSNNDDLLEEGEKLNQEQKHLQDENKTSFLKELILQEKTPRKTIINQHKNYTK